MADETVVPPIIPAHFPVKRAKAEDDNGGVVAVKVDDANNNNMSAVMNGWFSEISPMWPGVFISLFHLCPPFVVVCVCVCVWLSLSLLHNCKNINKDTIFIYDHLFFF